MKRYVVFLAIVSLMFLFAGCSINSEDIKDQIADAVQAEDEHVLGVKYGTNPNYPDITYAEAFEAFFSYPTWKYFEGSTSEEPDVINDVVEFTGRCMYKDVEVKAVIQFTISEDGETFRATYLSFNEIPQDMITLSALIDKVFSDYQSDYHSQNN